MRYELSELERKFPGYETTEAWRSERVENPERAEVSNGRREKAGRTQARKGQTRVGIIYAIGRWDVKRAGRLRRLREGGNKERARRDIAHPMA